MKVSAPEAQPRPDALHRSPVEAMMLRALLYAALAYCVLSSLTVPFLNSLWLGELPVLAVIQVPKVGLAQKLLTGVLMPALTALGWSRGSFSPDYIMLRPYALALAYLIGLFFVYTILALRTRLRPPYRRWALILLALAAVDYILTLYFANSRGLSIY